MSATHSKSVECSNCGEPLAPYNGSADEPPPCPRCDSTDRTIAVSIVEKVRVSDSVSVSVVKARRVPFDELLVGFPAWSVRTPELDEATWATVTDGLDGAKAGAVMVSFLGYPLEGGVSGLALILISRKVREKRLKAAKREAVTDDEGAGD